MKIKYLSSSLLVFLIMSCKQSTFFNKEFPLFYTWNYLNLYEGKMDYLNDIQKEFETYDKLSDNYEYRGINNVYLINQTNEEVQVDEKLYNLLKTSYEIGSKASYFNILSGSLVKKWKESLNEKKVLDDSVIANELNKINNSSLVFKDNNVVQRIGEAEIDLGGIVKGYCLDISSNYLKQNNMNKYLLNLGNSSLLLGEKDNKDGLFTVSLKDLPNKCLKLKNCYVSTSGVSVQGVKIGDITYSHIINPLTGSAINNYDAVIVISSTGYLGDALSTSMMMNTVEEIKEIETKENVQAIVIKDNKIEYKNSGIELYNK